MTNSLAGLAGRDVARIDSPTIGRGMADNHKVRQLVPPGDHEATDPFLLLMEDWFGPDVFDGHPHRGIETVTYVIDGGIDHFDNHGNHGIVGPGEALWLTAGRGIVHNEKPLNGEPVHLLQLWVNLPAAQKLTKARFQELRPADLPVRLAPGVEAIVFSGSAGGETAPTLNHAPITMVEVKLDPGATFEQDLQAGYNGFIVVLEGSGAFGTTATEAKAAQVAWLTQSEAESAIAMTAGAGGLRAMIFAGKPLGEPVAARGPFVMNTKEELDIGFAEFRRTGERFGL